MAKTATKEKVKSAIKKTSARLEKGVDQLAEGLQKATEMAKEASKRVEQALDKAHTSASREAGNVLNQNLQGTRLYAVHFVEYVDNKKYTDIPVFLASSPEWAIGFCKNHTDFAVKFEEDASRWWYFYIEEMAVNDSQSAQGWICTIDWNGRIANETFHFDKGYKHDYKKDHIIYEQSVDAQREGESKEDYEKRFERECAVCAENEKDEEQKTKERTEAALEKAKEFLTKFYDGVKSVDTKQEGDWYKLIAKGVQGIVTDNEYEILHKAFGIVAGNRILFYISK